MTRRGYFPKETNCAIALLRLYSDQHHHFQLGRLGSLGESGEIFAIRISNPFGKNHMVYMKHGRGNKNY